MKRLLYLILLGAISIAIFSHCSGLIKIKLAEEVYHAPDAWLVPAKNNLRQNSCDTDIQPPLKILWKKRHRSGITDHPLAIDNFLLATFKNGGISFYDTRLGERVGDGKLVPGLEHPPVIENGILYYAANLGDKTAGAIRLDKMKRIWEAKLPHLNASPTICGTRIIFAGINGEIFALDKESGEKLWEYKADSGIYGTPAATTDRICFASIKGSVYCLAVTTGKRLWKKELEANIYTGPTIGTDLLFIGTTAGYFHALDLQTGTSAWKFNSKKSIYANAAFKNGVVYFGNSGHLLYALNAKSGNLKWQFRTEGIISHPPLIGKKYIYCGSWDKKLYVLNRFSGREIYHQEFKRPVKTTPIIYRNRLYLNIANDRIYCLANENENFRKGK